MIDFRVAEVRPSSHLIVAFTGIMHGLGGIGFEFHKSLADQDAAVLFVRDLDVAWYQNAGDAALVLERIEWARATAGAASISCIGNSMGGFGALYFGSIIGAAAMLAFVPQTAIDPSVTSTIGDFRWSAHQARIAAYPFGDLRKVAQPAGRVAICYGTDDALDVAHVDHLAQAWRLDRIPVSNADHTAASALRERGQLVEVIQRVLVA